jgi:hypothetical protein
MHLHFPDENKLLLVRLSALFHAVHGKLHLYILEHMSTFHYHGMHLATTQ